VAELRTLARPYAEAIFDLARDAGTLDAWAEALEHLSAIVENEDVAGLIGHPKIDDRQLAEAIISVAGAALDEEGKNLVRLLTANDRLTLLPEIRSQFASLHAAAENRIEVTVTAADELTDAQRERISKALEQRLQRNIGLSTEIDPDLLGGAIIRAGDLVIDGSLRARLARLEQSLAH